MKIHPTREINFTAGRTRILSDFDGTFMPKEFNHDCICNDKPPVDREAFSAYFDSFDEFLKEKDADGKKNELTISTGRNLPEFNYYMWKIKNKDLTVPIPDRLITVNGGDEFISTDNDDFFTSYKRSMFTQRDINENEQSKLSRFLIGFDPEKISNRIMEFLINLKGSPRILEPGTHQGMYGYKGGITLQEEIEKRHNITNYVSMRQDGRYQIRLTAAKNSPYISSLTELPEILEKEGYAIYSKVNKKDGETFVNCADKKCGKKWHFGTSVGIKPLTSGKVKVLDKFHHAKIMADEILQKQSDDLVIVAGDGKNDLPMLDLSNYSDNMKDYTDFSKPEFKEEAQKLPVRAIYVRNSNSLDNIAEQYEANFNFDGVKRFIIVDKNDPTRPSTLLDAIKTAQVDYEKVNENYEKARNNENSAFIQSGD